MDDLSPKGICSNCNGTGEVDSGGVTPWGYGINIPCQCTIEEHYETV